MSKKIATLLALSPLLLLTTPAVHATDLSIVCDVKQTTGGKAQSAFKRRFDIDFEPRYFRSAVDTGKGFRGKEEGFPEDINAMRIVFVDDGNISQYYDRDTHEYVYQDLNANVEAKGKCREQPKGDQ